MYHSPSVAETLTRSISERDQLLGSRIITDIAKVIAMCIPISDQKHYFDNILYGVVSSDKKTFVNKDQHFLEILMTQVLYNDNQLKALALDFLNSLYCCSGSLK